MAMALQGGGAAETPHQLLVCAAAVAACIAAVRRRPKCHLPASSPQAVLPSVGFLWIAYMRRERALDELAKGGCGTPVED